MSGSFGLLIGGSSCVGKTTLARSLCDRFSLTLVQTDRILPNNPILNPLAGSLELWDRPPQELCRLLIAAASAAIPLIIKEAEVVSKSSDGWIVEGERIHPEVVERLQHDGLARGVFIVETDSRRLHDTLTSRLPGFTELLETRRIAVAELDRLYNVWLLSECARLGLRCIASQPWETLGERVLGSGQVL